jgi:hypothetical protein
MVLAAFSVALVLSLAATVFAAVRGLQLYRQLKRTRRALAEPLSAFEAKAAEVDRHLDAFEGSSRELERARERLRVSRARLQVLLDTVGRAQRRTRWIRVFLPR